MLMISSFLCNQIESMLFQLCVFLLKGFVTEHWASFKVTWSFNATALGQDTRTGSEPTLIGSQRCDGGPV